MTEIDSLHLALRDAHAMTDDDAEDFDSWVSRVALDFNSKWSDKAQRYIELDAQGPTR